MVYENLIGKRIRFAQKNFGTGRLFWRDGTLIEVSKDLLVVEILGYRKVYSGVIAVELVGV